MVQSVLHAAHRAPNRFVVSAVEAEDGLVVVNKPVWGTHVVEFCGCPEVGTLAEKVLFMEKVARRQSIESGLVVLLLFISGEYSNKLGLQEGK